MSKAIQAQAIFAEVNGVRADFINRAMTELSMSKAGASTYFQNCKTKSAGGQVKHYRKGEAKSTVSDKVDDSMEDADLFTVQTKDGVEHCFMSQEAADEFKVQNLKQIA